MRPAVERPGATRDPEKSDAWNVTKCRGGANILYSSTIKRKRCADLRFRKYSCVSIGRGAILRKEAHCGAGELKPVYMLCSKTGCPSREREADGMRRGEPCERLCCEGMSCRRQILAIARKVLEAGEDSEDVCQLVCVACMRRAPCDTPSAGVSAWRYRVTINAALGVLRSRTAATEGLLRLAALAIRQAEAGGGAGLVSVDLELDVRRVLERLPVRDRAILRMRYWDELSWREIGLSLEMSEAVARATGNRADAAFRTAWEAARGSERPARDHRPRAGDRRRASSL